ncbi:MAG TPA: UDP-N-acetylglucosamine 2-epimerase (non-hydrolyzing) [Terriglobales bacterium]|nr:UDP-N-acetylglucosamine 2-epimerase (non-hydrolyzing) [Terriglobales bacterium]
MSVILAVSVAQLVRPFAMPVTISHVVGARPNFMKAAPVIRALAEASGVQQTLVHTGQHYNVNMSDVFFQQLAMPAPDVNLRVGSGTHAQQTAAIISRFEPIVTKMEPSLVMVYGDVNSTIATAMVCAKLGIKVAHVEAGLRSFDRTMPEEINRVLTDQIADLLFTPSEDGNRNLEREGIPQERVHLVGNVMIDTLVRMLPLASLPAIDVPPRYILVTLHRPSNVDDLPWFERLLEILAKLAEHVPVLFPVHPRTARTLESRAGSINGCVRLLEPQPYLQFLALQQHATMVVTDSGGIQEETTYLGVPCLTVRKNTERPVTVDCGTNTVVGYDPKVLADTALRILAGQVKPSSLPPLWDGHAAERIARIVHNTLC